MMTYGFSQHRLIPDLAVVADLQSKWAELKDTTGRDTKLLFKRRLLRKDEALKVSEAQHACFSYRQALNEFLSYPLAEAFELMIRVAAAVLWTDRDFWWKVQQKGKLKEHGNLEQLLPDSFLRDHNRGKVVAALEEEFKMLQTQAD